MSYVSNVLYVSKQLRQKNMHKLRHMKADSAVILAVALVLYYYRNMFYPPLLQVDITYSIYLRGINKLSVSLAVTVKILLKKDPFRSRSDSQNLDWILFSVLSVKKRIASDPIRSGSFTYKKFGPYSSSICICWPK